MKVYESADFDWKSPEKFSFWDHVEPLEVRTIALSILKDYYRQHSEPLLNKGGYYGHYDGGEKDGQEVPWWDSGPAEPYVYGLMVGLMACASAGYLPETVPRVKENEESAAYYRTSGNS